MYTNSEFPLCIFRRCNNNNNNNITTNNINQIFNDSRELYFRKLGYKNCPNAEIFFGTLEKQGRLGMLTAYGVCTVTRSGVTLVLQGRGHGNEVGVAYHLIFENNCSTSVHESSETRINFEISQSNICNACMMAMEIQRFMLTEITAALSALTGFLSPRESRALRQKLQWQPHSRSLPPLSPLLLQWQSVRSIALVACSRLSVCRDGTKEPSGTGWKKWRRNRTSVFARLFFAPVTISVVSINIEPGTGCHSKGREEKTLWELVFFGMSRNALPPLFRGSLSWHPERMRLLISTAQVARCHNSLFGSFRILSGTSSSYIEYRWVI